MVFQIYFETFYRIFFTSFIYECDKNNTCERMGDECTWHNYDTNILKNR